MAFPEHCVVGMNFCAAAFIKFGLGFSPAILHILTASSRVLAPQIILVLLGYCILVSSFLLYISGTKTHFGVAFSFF